MGTQQPPLPAERVRVADLTGDGHPEVLVVRHIGQEPGTDAGRRDRVYCFSADGHLLWQYEPANTFTFDGKRYEGPWILRDWVLRREGAITTVWLAFVSAWWPSFVVRLDGKGTATTRFVNSGHIYRLHWLRSGPNDLLVLGGINNEYSSAMVAVLDPEAAPASSPQSEPKYQCDQCPAGKPLRFYLLPQSELSRLRDLPYNLVRSLYIPARGLIVDTLESDRFQADLLYLLLPDLRIVSAERSDGYVFGHRQLERSGAIDHPLDECPENTGIKVKVWDARSGWSEVLVPMAK